MAATAKLKPNLMCDMFTHAASSRDHVRYALIRRVWDCYLKEKYIHYKSVLYTLCKQLYGVVSSLTPFVSLERDANPCNYCYGLYHNNIHYEYA